MLLARSLTAAGPVRVLDAMAGCGIRALRYGLEAGAEAVWANDADPDRLPLLQRNLAGLPGLRCTARTAQQLLAECLVRQERFELVDLDGFGCPTALLPLALEAVAFDGVLYLASTDGRSPTGHDRPAAIRLLGSAARAHPASWELALRLQLGSVARAAWAMGRGVEPLFSFSEGRTFRTAVRLRRRASAGEERQLGMLAHCHACGMQQVQPLIQLRQWSACLCGAVAAQPLAISGPLWIGPLQDSALLRELLTGADAGGGAATLGRDGERLLARLAADPGLPVCCWPTAEIGKRLGCGPPPVTVLAAALQEQGYTALASGVMSGQLRSDAPWHVILQSARQLVHAAAGAAK